MTHPDFARAVELVTPEKIRDLTIALVDIPSATGHEAGVANFLAAHMADLGMEIDLPQVEWPRRWPEPAVHRPHGHLVFG